MSYLIIKCGSSARGDDNRHSDVDIVCLYDEAPDFELIKSRFKGVTFFSDRALTKMRAKGSLFLTHLDVDGSCIEGNKELLRLILSYRPKKSQLEKSINESVSFLSGIGWFPEGYLGNLWLLDVIYVSARNVIYCKNAINSIYEFGFFDSMKAFGLNRSDIELMKLVRLGKYAFRSKNRESMNKIDELPLKELSNLAEKIFGVYDVTFEKGGKTDWFGHWNYDYWDERFIERSILNNEIVDDGFLTMLRTHNYHRRELTGSVRRYVIEKRRSLSAEGRSPVSVKR